MGTKQHFSVEQVAETLPKDFVVEEADDGRGVRVTLSRELDGAGDKDNMLSPMPHILRAALAVALHPEQIEDNSRYNNDRRMGSSWTGEYGSEWIHYDVTFLYERPG